MQTPRAAWLFGMVVMMSMVSMITMATGCATATAFSSTWRNPETKPIKLDGQKVVVLVISTQEATRRPAEDTVAAQITARGAQGVPAWTILPTADMQNEEKARAALAQAGAVAVVTMEIVPGRNTRSPDFRRTMSDASRGTFSGNYRWGWNNAWYAGPPPNSSVWIETQLCSLEPDKLLWAGRSRTVNPNAVAAMFGEVANAAASEMERAGLIKGSK